MRDHKTIVPPKMEPPVASASPSVVSRVLKTLRRGTLYSVVGVGVGSAVLYAKNYWEEGDMARLRSKDKKVLVLPFHRMKLVETGSKIGGTDETFAVSLV